MREMQNPLEFPGLIKKDLRKKDGPKGPHQKESIYAKVKRMARRLMQAYSKLRNRKIKDTSQKNQRNPRKDKQKAIDAWNKRQR